MLALTSTAAGGAGNTTVEDLDLRNNNVGDVGAKLLAVVLNTNQSLTSLELRENSNITRDAGQQMLVKAVRENTTLVDLNSMRFEGVESVDLSGRNLHSLLYESSFVGSRMGLPTCVTQRLTLRRCHLSPFAVQEICNGVDVCATLKSFIINSNTDIGIRGVAHLTRMLSCNRSIEIMHLEDVGIRDEGAEYLFASVVGGSTVVDFNVRGNKELTRVGEAKCAARVWNPSSALEVLNIDVTLRGCHTLDLTQRVSKYNSDSWGHDDDVSAPPPARLALYEAAFIGDQLSREEVRTQKVVLDGNGVDAAACAHVCRGACANPSGALAELDLDNNEVADPGCTHIAEVLRANRGLHVLRLAGNGIGSAGATSLAGGIAATTVLHALDVRRNTTDLADESGGAEALVKSFYHNSSLLSLDGHDLSEYTSWHSLSNEPQLFYLIAFVGIRLAHPRVQSLRQLSINRSAVTDKGIAHFEVGIYSNVGLESLDVGRNDFTDVGVASLARGISSHGRLHTLEMRGRTYGADGNAAMIRSLESNTTLDTLNSITLTHECVDVSGRRLDHYEQVFIGSRLTFDTTVACDMDLSSTGFDDLGMTYVGEGLQRNETVTRLVLQKNAFCADGLSALASGLTENSHLRDLFVRGKDYGAAGDRAMNSVWTENHTLLNLDGIDLTDRGIVDLSGRTLALYEQGFIGSRLALTSTRVESLCLKDSAVTNDGLRWISAGLEHNTTVTHLDLSSNPWNQMGAIALASALKTNTDLETLTLIDNQMTSEGEGMKALVSAFKFNVQYPNTLNHIGMDRNLTEIIIPKNRGDLEYFEVGFIGMRLCGHPGISKVELSSRNVTALGVRDLAYGLIHNRTVKTLLLSSNPLGSAGCSAIAGLLEQNAQLLVLDIVNTSCGGDGDDALTSTFQSSDKTGLKVLDMIVIDRSIAVTNTRLFNYHTAFIGCRLRHGAHITSLDLSGCRSQNQSNQLDIQYLVDGAVHSASLSSLTLSNTKFGNIGATQIAVLLSNNQHLRALHVNDNGISHAGDQTVQKALKKNTGLMILNGINMSHSKVQPSRLEHNFDIVFIRSRIGPQHPCRQLMLNKLSIESEKLGGRNHSGKSIVLQSIGECAFYLTLLDLRENALSDTELKQIALSATGNDRLRVFYASTGNSFTANSSDGMSLMCGHECCPVLVEADGINLGEQGSDFSAKSHAALASTNALYAYALVGNVLQQPSCQIKNFKFVDVSLRSMRRLAEGFANNITVTTVTLNRCDLDHDDVSLLLNALKRNRMVRTLDLEDCKGIGDKGGLYVGKVLNHTSVQKLLIDTSSMTVSGLKRIAEGVGNLSDLKLQHCKAGGWSYTMGSDPVRTEAQDDDRGISDDRNSGWVEIENAMPRGARLSPVIERSYDATKSEQMGVRRKRRLDDEEEERRRLAEEERKRREEEERKRREEEERRRREEERKRQEDEAKMWREELARRRQEEEEESE